MKELAKGYEKTMAKVINNLNESQNKALEIARNMLQMNIDIDIIYKTMGLSKKIIKLKS